MLNVLQDWFNNGLDTKDGLIRTIIDHEASKCYTDWKSNLHDYLKNTATGLHPTYLRLLTIIFV